MKVDLYENDRVTLKKTLKDLNEPSKILYKKQFSLSSRGN